MKLLVIAGSGTSTNILVNWLCQNGYDVVEVIVEQSIPIRTKLLARARRLGWRAVLGQVLFQGLIVPVLRRASASRIKDILGQHDLDVRPPGNLNLHVVSTVNSDETIRRINDRKPDLVIVNGTRIIRKSVLESVNAPFLNTHCGITPHYRGVHGGYWALWNDDRGRFGVTIHQLDAGVDTGPVLWQAVLDPRGDDNFATYPLLQQAGSFSGMKEILDGFSRQGGFPPSFPTQGDGKQWFHPTIVDYLRGRLRGVR